MSLRPAPANGFEVLVLRDELTTAIDALARSASVELQSHGEASVPLMLPECRDMLGEFVELRRRYERYWPEPCRHDPDERLEPHSMLADAIQRIRAWTEDAREPVVRVESLISDADGLRVVLSLLTDGDPPPDLSMFRAAGPMLATCAFLLPGYEWPE